MMIAMGGAVGAVGVGVMGGAVGIVGVGVMGGAVGIVGVGIVGVGVVGGGENSILYLLFAF